jgi:hypothetical protein
MEFPLPGCLTRNVIAFLERRRSRSVEGHPMSDVHPFKQLNDDDLLTCGLV